ncbi:MAG: hypothetical protein QNI84_11430 [Henriciella sp.]|nr:hypothetical protein [Henriciella sp.]
MEHAAIYGGVGLMAALFITSASPSWSQSASEDLGVGLSIHSGRPLSVSNLDDVILTNDSRIFVDRFCVDRPATAAVDVTASSANSAVNPFSTEFRLTDDNGADIVYWVGVKASLSTQRQPLKSDNVVRLRGSFGRTVCSLESGWENEIRYEIRATSLANKIDEFGLDDGEPHVFTDILTLTFSPVL